MTENIQKKVLKPEILRRTFFNGLKILEKNISHSKKFQRRILLGKELRAKMSSKKNPKVKNFEEKKFQMFEFFWSQEENPWAKNYWRKNFNANSTSSSRSSIIFLAFRRKKSVDCKIRI